MGTGRLGSMEIEARRICMRDPDELHDSFSGTPWNRGLGFFQQLLADHEAGTRVVWVGLANGRAVAFGSLVWQSDYPPFREERIPEIKDLNVAPRFRRLGVATSILDCAEKLAFKESNRVGIGFGLHPGYRAAQRLYVLRGYVPDGNGVFSGGRFPAEGEQVTLDDHLVLYLTKRNPTRHAA